MPRNGTRSFQELPECPKYRVKYRYVRYLWNGVPIICRDLINTPTIRHLSCVEKDCGLRRQALKVLVNLFVYLRGDKRLWSRMAYSTRLNSDVGGHTAHPKIVDSATLQWYNIYSTL